MGNSGYSRRDFLNIVGMGAAALAIPMISSASGVQVRSAANLLASDIEYTKNMSIRILLSLSKFLTT